MTKVIMNSSQYWRTRLVRPTAFYANFLPKDIWKERAYINRFLMEFVANYKFLDFKKQCNKITLLYLSKLSIDKIKLYCCTHVAFLLLVFHSYRTCVARVSLVSQSCCTCVARVTLVLHLCRSCLALVL